jgi:hypothetical protein
MENAVIWILTAVGFDRMSTCVSYKISYVIDGFCPSYLLTPWNRVLLG